jgi:hypothetical protein
VAARHAKLPAYDQELIGLVKPIRHWHPYVWGQFFNICTDHFSLKYILDQHTWVSELFGYDFTVEYQQGKFNVVTDALSRHDVDSLAAHAISTPSFLLYDQLRAEISELPQTVQLHAQILEGTAPAGWIEKDGLLLFQDTYSYQMIQYYGQWF